MEQRKLRQGNQHSVLIGAAVPVRPPCDLLSWFQIVGPISPKTPPSSSTAQASQAPGSRRITPASPSRKSSQETKGISSSHSRFLPAPKSEPRSSPSPALPVPHPSTSRSSSANAQ